MPQAWTTGSLHPSSHAYKIQQLKTACTLSHVYWHNQPCKYLVSCIDQTVFNNWWLLHFKKQNKHISLIGWCFPLALWTDDDACFPRDRQPFVTLTCSGSGRAVWGRGCLAENGWIGMDQHRQTNRQTDNQHATDTLHAHSLPVCLSALALCSVPNIITLQGHAVYSSACLGIRYENSLSIWVCVCVCEAHMEVEQDKQKSM